MQANERTTRVRRNRVRNVGTRRLVLRRGYLRAPSTVRGYDSKAELAQRAAELVAVERELVRRGVLQSAALESLGVRVVPTEEGARHGYSFRG